MWGAGEVAVEGVVVKDRGIVRVGVTNSHECPPHECPLHEWPPHDPPRAPGPLWGVTGPP